MASDQKNRAAVKIARVLNRYALWLTLFFSSVLLLVFYHEFILTESSQKALYLPLGHYGAMSNIPLWNPNIYGGMPIWGNPADVARINIIDSALFAALTPVRPFLPDANFLYLMLNLLLLGGFTFAFMRQLGIRQTAAAFVAVLVQFVPPYVISVVSGAWINILALCLTPVVLYFTSRLLEQRNLIWFSLGAFFFAFQLLRASAPVTILTIALVLVLYVIYCFSWRHTSKIRALMSRGPLCLAMLAAGFLLAAYVYLPFFEFLKYAVVQNSPELFSVNDFFLYAYPSFNGLLTKAEEHIVLYSGIVVLFLSGFAILLRRNWRTYLLLSLCGVFWFCAFVGYWGPTVYAVPFIFLILSGIGVNALIQYRQKTTNRRPSRWLDIYMLIVWGIFSAGFAIIFINKPGYMQYILKQLPMLKLFEQNAHYQKVLVEGGVVFALIGFSFLIIRLFLNKKMITGTFVGALLVLALIDLLVVDYKLVNNRPHQAARLPLSVLEVLRDNRQPYRIFSTTEHNLGEFASVLGDTKSVLKTYDGFLRSSGFGEPDVEGMRNPFFSKYTRLVARGAEVVEEPIPVDYIDPARLNFDRAMLSLLNVKYIVCNSPIHDINYAIIYDDSFFVYENTTALPRAFFVDSLAVLPGHRAIFDAMQAVDFDPRKLAFLEQDPEFAVYRADSNTVRISSYRDGWMAIEANVKQPALLVLSEVFYPVGWSVFVDNRPALLYETNYFMRSIFLKPGTHRIRVEFVPPLFRAGVWISFTSFVLVIGAFISGLVFHFRRKAAARAALKIKPAAKKKAFKETK